MMKKFLQGTLLAVGVQALLAGATLLVFFLFHLPQDTWLIGWGRIYSPTIILVMMLFMAFSSMRNLGVALVLGFLLGAFLYGAIFSFILNSFRKHRTPKQVSKNITHEATSPEHITE